MFTGLFQPMHLIIILVIVLIVFGPGRLPEIGKALGNGIRDFKKSVADAEENLVTTQKTRRILMR
jgi:sec-independent protein translocase protein TatA